MSNTPPNVLQLARQGNPDAIAALMNRHLEAQGITAHVMQQESTLQVDLEGAQIHNQADLVAYVKKGITGLELAAVNRLVVSGKEAGASTSAWSENLALREEASDFMLDFDADPSGIPAGDNSDLGLDFDLDSAALEINSLSDLDAALGDEISGADFGLDDLGLTDSSGEPSPDAPADFDLNFDDGDFGLDLANTGADAADSTDFDFNFDDNDLAESGTGAETTDSTDFDLNFDDSDLGFDLAESGAGAEAADLNLDSGVDEAFDSKAFDLDLAMADETSANSTDLDFDLGLAETTSLTDDLDFDLDLADGSAESNTPADLSFDLGFTDESSETAASDLDFDDLGLDSNAGETAASNLDFDDLGLDSNAGETAASDLNFDDLGLDSSAGETAASDLNFDDLGLDSNAGETAASNLDFDDLGLDSNAGETAASNLDFDDLGLGDEAASGADLDLSWSEASGADSSADELDLGLAEAPAADLSTPEFDLDLGLTEPSTETWTAEALDVDNADFDLGFDAVEDEGIPGSSEALDLDLGAEFDPEAGLDLPDLEDGSAAIADDLQIDGSDVDFISPPANPTSLDKDVDLDDLWGDGDASSTDLSAETDSAAIDDLAAIDPIDDALNTEVGSFDDWPDLDADADGDLGNDLEIESLEAETAETGAIAFEAATFSSLESEDLSLEGSDGADDPSPDPTPEEFIYEDPEAVETLDLAGDSAAEDWAPDPADLSLSADASADLANYGDLGTDVPDTPGFELGNDQFTASPASPFTEDIDPAAADEPFPDLLGVDPLAAETLATHENEAEAAAETFGTEFGTDWADPSTESDFSEVSTPPWEEAAGEFDPELTELDASGSFEANPGTEFDPGLVFEPQAEAIDTTPNPFEVGTFEADTSSSEGLDPEAEGDSLGAFDLEDAADLPFSTMELDQTVEGNAMPDLPPGGSLSEQDNYDEAFLSEQPEGYLSEVDPAPVPLGFGDEDLAFESVEFAGSDLGGPGFEVSGFSDGADDEPPVFIDDASFEDEGFSDEGFGVDDFGDEGFDAEAAFSDGIDDSNGFIQDRNGAVLMEDEPDATDDFIQEFGSDPSAHVALTPDQFNDDNRGRSGSSGLPLRLILGLGLGALVLALAGLLLNGLLGRLRQPSPGGDSVVTEPAVPAPTPPPAEVPDEDLFRQAVNAAQSAANQAQTASTAEQWQAVADAWSNSIELMKRVPQSDPNYAVAQQKVVDYQPNLDYAQQNVQRLK